MAEQVSITRAPWTLAPSCKFRFQHPSRHNKITQFGSKLTLFFSSSFSSFSSSSSSSSSSSLRYGPDVPSLDGLVVRDVPVEPYMLLRGAHEHGAMAVIDLMEKYPKNRHVVLFGFLSMAKMDIVETEDGVASLECVRSVKYTLVMMDEWTANAAILAAAMANLASLTDNYANRIAINEEKWMPRVVKLMKSMETETNEVYIR